MDSNSSFEVSNSSFTVWNSSLLEAISSLADCNSWFAASCSSVIERRSMRIDMSSSSSFFILRSFCNELFLLTFPWVLCISALSFSWKRIISTGSFNFMERGTTSKLTIFEEEFTLISIPDFCMLFFVLIALWIAVRSSKAISGRISLNKFKLALPDGCCRYEEVVPLNWRISIS